MAVRLRLPRGGDVTAAWARVLADGEPELVRATVDRQDDRDTWLRAEARPLTFPSSPLKG